jgi:hypothetical protein
MNSDWIKEWRSIYKYCRLLSGAFFKQMHGKTIIHETNRYRDQYQITGSEVYVRTSHVQEVTASLVFFFLN